MYDAIKMIWLVVFLLCSLLSGFSQTITRRLQTAFARFESDSQMRNGISSLYIADKKGKVIFKKNERIGLAPASTQKVITAATAYELLGTGFRYETEFGFKGKVDQGNLKGLLYLIGSGDPTFGSWRYQSTHPELIHKNINTSLSNAGIKNDSLHPTHLVLDLSGNNGDVYNDNWMWQDLGNYYGIGSCAINWRENQFDAVITPGKNVGDRPSLIKLTPRYVNRRLGVFNDLFTGRKGSGDNAYFYLELGASGFEYALTLKGTIPAGVDSFVVSASHPNPVLYFTESLMQNPPVDDNVMHPQYSLFGRTTYLWTDNSDFIQGYSNPSNVLYKHISPSLDSIIYWFLKKSINLYGEALIQTIAKQKKGIGQTNEGIEILQKFWKAKNLEITELNLSDGSGLSPLNRVTTHAQVKVLQFAKNQQWFNGFYEAFPEFNGMKMKSGTINGVKGFCGYHKSKDGKEYIFSFLVNNYNGSASAVVKKMYQVLDVLK